MPLTKFRPTQRDPVTRADLRRFSIRWLAFAAAIALLMMGAALVRMAG